MSAEAEADRIARELAQEQLGDPYEYRGPGPDLSDWYSPEDEVYDVPAEVCTAHLRFVPCRKQGPHSYSSAPGDVKRVRVYQAGTYEDTDAAGEPRVVRREQD